MSIINPLLSESEFCIRYTHIHEPKLCTVIGAAMTECMDIYLLSNMQEAINLYEIL